MLTFLLRLLGEKHSLKIVYLWDLYFRTKRTRFYSTPTQVLIFSTWFSYLTFCLGRKYIEYIKTLTSLRCDCRHFEFRSGLFKVPIHHYYPSIPHKTFYLPHTHRKNLSSFLLLIDYSDDKPTFTSETPTTT